MTNQNLNESFKLSVGMTKQEVLRIMGDPIKSDFEKNVEEWFYCRTGGSSLSNFSPIDEHLVLFFHEDKLISKTNYTVTIKDSNGVQGSCEKFIKRGDYRVPDEVIEIRLRN